MTSGNVKCEPVCGHQHFIMLRFMPQSDGLGSRRAQLSFTILEAHSAQRCRLVLSSSRARSFPEHRPCHPASPALSSVASPQGLALSGAVEAGCAPRTLAFGTCALSCREKCLSPWGWELQVHPVSAVPHFWTLPSALITS